MVEASEEREREAMGREGHERNRREYGYEERRAAGEREITDRARDEMKRARRH